MNKNLSQEVSQSQTPKLPQHAALLKATFIAVYRFALVPKMVNIDVSTLPKIIEKADFWIIKATVSI